MRHILFVALAAFGLALFGNIGLATGPAEAGASCKKGYYFDASSLSCKMKVKINIKQQDRAVAGAPQWGPPNRTNCAKASNEMDRSAARCRNLDAKRAYDAVLRMVVNGKLLKECATCCRQLREGMNRWKQCHELGLAPRPDYATARRSATLMNCNFTY